MCAWRDLDGATITRGTYTHTHTHLFSQSIIRFGGRVQSVGGHLKLCTELLDTGFQLLALARRLSTQHAQQQTHTP